MIVYEKISCSRTRSSHYIESFVPVKTFCPHIWGQNVVCIKCGSLLAETYTHTQSSLARHHHLSFSL